MKLSPFHYPFRKTAYLIKRDIKEMFSSKRRAETEYHRQRLQNDMPNGIYTYNPMNLDLFPKSASTLALSPLPAGAAVAPTTTPSMAYTHQGRPETPVCLEHTLESSPITTVLSNFGAHMDSSTSNTPSTATDYHSVESAGGPYYPSYRTAMDALEYWYKKQHPASTIPESERKLHRGVVIILVLALWYCADNPIFTLVFPGRAPTPSLHSTHIMTQLLVSLDSEHSHAVDAVLRLLSSVCPDLAGPQFLERIGDVTRRLSDEETNLLRDKFSQVFLTSE